jgi:hypothetical protein
MTEEKPAIEVEVLEIDGHAPVVKPEPTPTPRQKQPWQQWQGRVRQLDARWWPLWVILGAIAVVLLLTVGVIFSIIFLILKILRGIIRAIFG